MRVLKRFLIFFCLIWTPLGAVPQSLDELMEALEIAAYWDRVLYTRFPLTFNHTLSAGYFVTHSARMTADGAFGIGVAHAPPYLNWNFRIQPFCNMELSANYRVFRGCIDSSLSEHGFGDYADRGANFKIALATPEQTFYDFPGIAFGIDDFMGTKKFKTYYVVATQVLQDWGIEASFGWGAHRYTKGPSRGFFGGFNWFPFWSCPYNWPRTIALSAEFDPTNYHKEPHPLGRVQHTPINYGIKYTYQDVLELSASRIRGDAFAFAGSLHYNWGASEGLVPKIKDPPPYAAPIDTQPLGCYRPHDVMIQELNYALEEQGFQLTHAWLEPCGDASLQLRLMIMNCRYRQERAVRLRLQHLLAFLTPSNIDRVVVILESYALPCQEYVYDRNVLVRYATQTIGPYEFDILTPRREAKPPLHSAKLIFQQRYDLWHARISPRFETFLGSRKGKFQYDMGLKFNLDGCLPYHWFYDFQVSYTAYSTAHHVSDSDFFSPSQLPNVATDYIRYRQQSAFTWDKIYAQKSWNLTHGFFGRVAGGYFQVNYGGVAAELLLYPANSCFAIGLEGAVVKKRNYSGLGFQSTLREFKGKQPIYKPYTVLTQYFLDLYFDFPALSFFTKISTGQFLARDFGVCLEATRYFSNGLRISAWMTFTNAADMMHGDRYFNRGVAFEVPFDLFFRCSSRRVWNYAMAAWLRDAGYKTSTGKPLFEIISRERRW